MIPSDMHGLHRKVGDDGEAERHEFSLMSSRCGAFRSDWFGRTHCGAPAMSYTPPASPSLGPHRVHPTGQSRGIIQLGKTLA